MGAKRYGLLVADPGGEYKQLLFLMGSRKKARELAGTIKGRKVAVVVKKGPGSDSPNDIIVNGARVEILEEREAGEHDSVTH